MASRDIEILREAITKLAQMLAGKGFVVTQRGMKAYVKADPRTHKPISVNLPFIPDEASEELILAIQGFLDHEVAHILYTNWGIVGEAMRKGETWHFLQNTFEDTLIERLIGKDFPGAVHNLDKLHHFFIKHLTAPNLAKAKTDAERFNILVVPLARALSGQRVFQEYLTEVDGWSNPTIRLFIETAPEALLARIPRLMNSAQAWEVAQEVHAIMFPPPPPKPKEEPKPETKEKGEGKGEEGEPSPGESSKPEPEPEEEPGSAEPEDDDAGVDPTGEDEDAGEPEAAEPDGDESEDAGEPEADDESEDAEPDGDEDEVPGEPIETGTDETDFKDEGDEPEDAGASEGKSEDGESEADEGDAGDEEGKDAEAGSKSADADEDGEEAGAAGAGAADEDDEHDGERVDDGRMSVGSDKEGETGAADDARPFADLPIVLRDEFSDALAGVISDASLRATKDAPYTLFTKDLDVIEPHKPSLYYEDIWLTELEDRVRGMVGVMQKDIERMMAARSQTINIPGFRSGRLHGASLHRIIAGDDRVFRRRTVNHSKDTAVGLLIDNSGSMGGGKMRLAMETAYALSQTLDRVGITHELIGFTTSKASFLSHRKTKAEIEIDQEIREEEKRLGHAFSRTEPLYMPVYKSFDERLNPTTKKRIVDASRAADFLANNVDGECVEIATMRLLRRKETRKVLLVLSDGFPACYGSAPQQYSKLHAAVAFAEKAKVDCIGIGIMSPAVKTFYPKHLVLNDLDSLPAAVMGQLKAILTG